MIRSICAFAASGVLSACAVIPTFGTISKTPIQLPGGELAYVYEGRANFPHQQEVADKMMAEHCQAVNSGIPVIVNAQQFVIGSATTGNTTGNISGTASGPYQQRTFNAATTSSNTGTALANRQQQLVFRCVKR